MQIAVEARTLMGANHRTISCNVLVVNEQMIPNIIRMAADNRTICRAVLLDGQYHVD